VLAANQANGAKTRGPTTDAGKHHAKHNALKHGLYAKELAIPEEDQPEFKVMRDGLLQQFTPATPLQVIARERIVCCCWRCKMALRMENRTAALQLSSKIEPKVQAVGGGDTILLEEWYGADYRSLQDGLRFLRQLRADVAEHGLFHLEQDGPLKGSLIKGFGLNFYNRLIEWKGMNVEAIRLAQHLVAQNEAYGMESSVFETSKVVPDPRLQWQMVIKLLEVQIEHLETLDRVRGKDFSETSMFMAESSPRYYADASRDLERAVDWFQKLTDNNL
jgi:hypothetical protein